MSAIKKLIELPLTRPSLLGAVLAVVVGIATFMYLDDGEAGTVDAGAVETVPVLVAAADISDRARLTERDLELREIPATAAHPSALRAVDDAIDLFASGFIAEGQQILPYDVSENVFGGGLAQIVPDGRRAVSIAISNAAAAGGLVSPGDHIDVVAIFNEDLRGEAGTTMITQNVEILALSQLVLGEELGIGEESPTAGQSPTAVAWTVTVAVSLEDAQRIALAESYGDLRIFLRNPDDDSEPFAAPVDLESVVRG